MKRCDWGWQGEAKKLRVRAEYLLTNLTNLPVPADVTLEFDKDGSVETVAAHKIFLAIGSEVFMAMFYGPAADVTQTKVQIPNYCKTVFEALVHYLYSDRIPDSFYTLNDDGLWMELLECAIQYGVPELATKCRVAIADSLTFSNSDVCTILVEARRLDETEIERAALRALDESPIRTLLNLPNMRDITKELLTEIVQRSELNIKPEDEILLYDAVRQWAIANVGREKHLLEPCSESCEHCIIKKDPVRQLGTVFKHIRFPLMTRGQLASGPIKDGIFTSAELSQLFTYKLIRNIPPSSADAQFPFSRRQIKSPTETGKICLECKPSNGRNDTWTNVVSVTVVPDWEACPDTSRRFISLCKEGYEFALLAQSRAVLDYAQQAKFDVDPIQPIQELFLPLPTSENSLMHDSGGTVSLSLVENEEEEGSYYKLFISPGKEEENTGIVFGRLAEWDENLYKVKAIANLTSTAALDFRLCSTLHSLGPY